MQHNNKRLYTAITTALFLPLILIVFLFIRYSQHAASMDGVTAVRLTHPDGEVSSSEPSSSVFTEIVFGKVFWDYSHLPFNLGGRINLLYCFFWGIAAVVWLKGIYPRLSGWIEKLPMSVGRAGTWIIVVFMLVNMAVSALALARYTERVTTGAPAENALETLLDQRFPNERMERVYPNAILVED